MSITPDELTAICGYVYDLCGIHLDDSKDYLIECRLGDIVKEADWRELCRAYPKGKAFDGQLLRSQIIDAITTNETLFFRDGTPFEALRHKAIPETIDSKSGSLYPRRLKIWCAACSTGQEPYSIAMTLCEYYSRYLRLGYLHSGD